MLKVRKVREELYVVDFFQYDYYEDVETMAEILEKKLGIEFTKKLDGPDCRVWIFFVDGVKLTLENDWTGCSIYAKSEASKQKLEELLPKLNKAFDEN